MLDDELDLIKSFIEYAINRTNTCFSQYESAPPVIEEIPFAKGYLRLVITKNKSCSWAEDLHECRSVAERTRVYN